MQLYQGHTLSIPKPTFYYIYQLVNSGVELPFYVGVTVNPKARAYGHKALLRGVTQKRSQVCELVILDMFYSLTWQQALIVETLYILKAKSEGANLKNKFKVRVPNSGSLKDILAEIDRQKELAVIPNVSHFVIHDWPDFMFSLPRL